MTDTSTTPLTDQQLADGWPHARHLRSRVHVILSENIHVGRVPVVTDEVVALVLPELDHLTAVARQLESELGRVRAELAEIDNAITWETTCLSCAKVLDSSIREYERAEKAEGELLSARTELAVAQTEITRLKEQIVRGTL